MATPTSYSAERGYMHIVMIGRKETDLGSVAAFGPFPTYEDAAAFIANAHDGHDGFPHLWPEDIKDAEILWVNDPTKAINYAILAQED